MNKLTTGALSSAMLLLNHAYAADYSSSTPDDEIGKVPEMVEGDKVTTSISLDINSHFMSYGLNVWGAATEDIGDEFLFQPSVNFDFATSDNTGIYTGIWADVNNIGPQATTTIGSSVQEIDVWLGGYITINDFTFDLNYQAWMYASEMEGIIDFTVSYDTMFSPYVKFHNRIETVGGLGQQTGTIAEFGGTLYEFSPDSYDVSFSFPAGIGAALSDFHVDDESGYAYSFVGANFTYPLPISKAYGAWDFHGGLTYFDTDDDVTGNAESGYLTSNFGIGISF